MTQINVARILFLLIAVACLYTAYDLSTASASYYKPFTTSLPHSNRNYQVIAASGVTTSSLGFNIAGGMSLLALAITYLRK